MKYLRLIAAALLAHAQLVLVVSSAELDSDSASPHARRRHHPLVRTGTRHKSRKLHNARRELQTHDWTQQIEAFKPMVVNVESSTEVVLETEETGTSTATGFIVDASLGIIATNRHVTGTSPSYVKISFYDGSFTEAKILYYDPTHDFGFYRFDPADVLFDVQAVTIGSGRENIALGDEVLLIGNNEAEEYSIKFGRIGE